MKRIHSIIYTTLAITVLLASCTKKIDEVFKNPNANVVQPIEKLLPNIISSMVVSYTTQGTNYGLQNDGLYVGRYVQFWATNVANNQYDQMGGSVGQSPILGSIWAMHYYAMGQNLNRVMQWGEEQKKWDYVGVGHALRAWSWLTLTDMYGEVILKEAFDPNLLVFHYDEQKDVYEEVRNQCRLAIENLNKTGDSVNQANLALGDKYFYNGDVAKWKKFVYAVMARSFHRVTNKAEYKPDSVIFYCNLAINDNADNASVKFAGTGTSTNSYYGPFRGNLGAYRQTKFIADLMSGVNSAFPVADPRAWYIIRENTNGTFKGVRPVKGVESLVVADQPQNFWGGAYSTTTGSNANARYVFKDAMPWPIITASEVQFMKAEAYYRKGMKTEARTAYRNGISLNIDMLNTDYSTSVPAAKLITTTVKNDFLANTSVVPAEANLNLSHIMLQKFIAMYGYGFVETWVDMRRYHYTDPETNTSRQVYTDFTPPAPGDLYPTNNMKLVYRARPLYSSENLYNADALTLLGGLDLDYNTKEMWFSKP